MLELRSGCECCGGVLDPSAAGAFICSFECTFCAACAGGRLNFRCPNCAGVLVARPSRAAHLLAAFPASAAPIRRAEACAGS